MNLSIESLFVFVVGTGFGVFAAYIVLRSRLTVEKGRADQAELALQAERSRGQQEMARQKDAYEHVIQNLRLTEETVKSSFTAVATSVLDKNTQRFKESAEKDLRQIKTEGVADFDSRVKLFEQGVHEIRTRLAEANEKISGFEKERVEMYARLEQQMRQISEQEQKLISETDRLKSALTTSSSVRGRWGELVLRNILQSSELMQHIDYQEQAGTRTEEGDDLKPDFVIRLPNAGQYLVIDAKTSLYESYLDGETVKTEAERKQVHQDYAKKVRKRVVDLGSKEYQKNVSDSVPYVIMFVPGEAAVRAAFDADPEIFQFAMERKVFIASPATIIPLLLLIANAWQQFKMSTQAAELSKVVAQVGDRLNLFVDRLGKVQKGLEMATRAWNETIDKSWNGQQSVVRAIDKARELGGQIPELSAIETIQISPRATGPETRDVIELAPPSETALDSGADREAATGAYASGDADVGTGADAGGDGANPENSMTGKARGKGRTRRKGKAAASMAAVASPEELPPMNDEAAQAASPEASASDSVEGAEGVEAAEGAGEPIEDKSTQELK